MRRFDRGPSRPCTAFARFQATRHSRPGIESRRQRAAPTAFRCSNRVAATGGQIRGPAWAGGTRNEAPTSTSSVVGRLDEKPSSSTPTAELVTSAASRMIASAYATGLQRNTAASAAALCVALAGCWPRPNRPAVFTDEQVREFVREQIAAGTVPGPTPSDQTLCGTSSSCRRMSSPPTPRMGR